MCVDAERVIAIQSGSVRESDVIDGALELSDEDLLWRWPLYSKIWMDLLNMAILHVLKLYTRNHNRNCSRSKTFGLHVMAMIQWQRLRQCVLPHKKTINVFGYNSGTVYTAARTVMYWLSKQPGRAATFFVWMQNNWARVAANYNSKTTSELHSSI